MGVKVKPNAASGACDDRGSAGGGVAVDDEMRVGGGERSGEIEVVGAEVAQALLYNRRALAYHDGPKVDGRGWVGDLADRAVAFVDDEEIAAAVYGYADGVVELGELAKPPSPALPAAPVPKTVAMLLPLLVVEENTV